MSDKITNELNRKIQTIEIAQYTLNVDYPSGGAYVANRSLTIPNEKVIGVTVVENANNGKVMAAYIGTTLQVWSQTSTSNVKVQIAYLV